RPPRSPRFGVLSSGAREGGAMSSDSPALTTARDYLLTHGFRSVPVPYRQKRPILKGWQRLRLDAADLPRYFTAQEQNIGLLLGEPSGGLLDVDKDADEARIAARFYLPPTPMRSGRRGKPDSHDWYRATANLPSKTERYQDTDGTTLIELRSTGGQTI